MSDRNKPQKEVPLQIVDKKNGKVYNRGKYLGKGGFARCYELIDNKIGEIVAGKVVPKALLTRKPQKDKMAQEIDIQKSLNHPHVVKMFDYFEDDDNVYILLELCPRRSLMELHKRRKTVTEPEARYFTKQIVDAVSYLHGRNVIHRDLKLGNLFLSELMDVKVGDFGLATVVESDGERKKTLCGTPNYIAPEMLDKRGHSFEVDIWAIGCILYTLLVGRPPFETLSLKDTYSRIKTNSYVVPPIVSSDAKQLIKNLLHADPAQRPHVKDIFEFNFFKRGDLPVRLPTSCLTMAPKFCNSPARQDNRLPTVQPGNIQRTPLNPMNHQTPVVKERDDWYLGELNNQLCTLFSNPIEEVSSEVMDEALHPASTPVYFISKWVDYSDKYGLGYQLSDNSVGVLFNDATKLVIDAAGEQIQYCERNNSEYYFTINDYPKALEKKITLLKYFRRYMREHLVRAVTTAPREGDELARLPVLRTWFRTKAAIVLHLTSGTLQINFFSDHAKLVVCPHMGAVSFIGSDKNLKTYKFDYLSKVGCEASLLRKIQYTKHIVERMLSPSQNPPGNNKIDYTAIEAAYAPDVRAYKVVK
ncbi:Serine/threonine-protein kinase polo [Strongyloides ratti]|uniref:Serine/threonine-protein kinase PLK n=1 Tax=Strongyloides ratti TaxID=34506 RepID=A0A090LER2_STRRB|nr:Serine/threonine-protein kinase polo [Strongyloides ratti]CEF66638.1 Serine/threonine-protein kinase polo [Strongyloides ratti]